MKEGYRPDMYAVKELDSIFPPSQFEVLFVLSREFDHQNWSREVEEREIREEVQAVLGDQAQPKASYYTYQRGADWETILIAVAAVFLAGPKFRDALNAWGEMAGKVVDVWRRLTGKRDSVVFFHPMLAGPVAMAWLRDKDECGQDKRQRVLSITEVVTYRSPSSDDPFRYTPERVYVVTVEDPPRETDDTYNIHVVTMTSTGAVIGHSRVPIGIWPGPALF